jgi:hypothetical protein
MSWSTLDQAHHCLKATEWKEQSVAITGVVNPVVNRAVVKDSALDLTQGFGFLADECKPCPVLVGLGHDQHVL